MTTLEHAYVLLCLGLDFRRGGFVDRAFEAFSEVVKLDPGNQYALLNLEKLHEEQHQWREAKILRQRMSEVASDSSGDRDQAILAFLENELGLQAMRGGELSTAAKHFETAIDLDQRTVPAYLNLGDVRLKMGSTEEAIATWQEVLRVAPERAYLAFGRLQQAFSDADASSRFLDLCRRIIEANQQDWRARLALGQYHAARGEPARALDLLFESLVHNPHALTIHQTIWLTLTTLDFEPELVRRYVSLTTTPSSTWIRTCACGVGIGAPSCSGSARNVTSGTPSWRNGSRRPRKSRKPRSKRSRDRERSGWVCCERED